ncbi:MAG: helix-turn-helix domain-containing protein [Trebonia sp.]
MKRQTKADKALEVCGWIDSGKAREWRVLSGLSLRESADSCEVTSVAVLRWERGERRPRGRNVLAYHKLLASLAAKLDA